MIRPATLDDLPLIAGLLRDFHSMAEQPQEFIDADVISFMATMIQEHVVLLSKRGLICGMVSSSPVNKNWLIGFELYWFSTDGQGNQLMKKFNEKMKSLGVAEIRISHMPKDRKVGRYLKHIGFSLDEAVYSRIL